MEQGKNPLAARRWARPWDASVGKSQLCLLGNHQSVPSQRALPIHCDNHGNARGGLPSDANGISSPQSKTAAVSDGTSAGP